MILMILYKVIFIPHQLFLLSSEGQVYYLGDNTGIINKFVDSTATLGVTYYYAVCAYDAGDAGLDIQPTENSKFLIRSNTGQVIVDDNTGFITPGARPLGYTSPGVQNFKQSEGFIGTGNVVIEVVDDEAIRNNFSYKVAFEDTGALGNTINWSLIDLVTPDTVYVPSINKTYIVEPLQTIPLPAGTDTIYVNTFPVAVFNDSYTGNYDSLVAKSKMFTGNTPIRQGFRLQLFNDDVIKLDTAKSGFENGVTTPNSYSFSVLTDGSFPQNNGVTLPNNYVVEFFNTIVDTSQEVRLFPPSFPANFFPAVPVNFKVKNLTQDKYIDFFYKKTGTISTNYNIYFRESVRRKFEEIHGEWLSATPGLTLLWKLRVF